MWRGSWLLLPLPRFFIIKKPLMKARALMLLAALSLITLYFLPLWSITLSAPQYPDPIGMNIWINKIVDKNPNDIKNINLMNHYVGMKDIPTHMDEFDIFPKVIAFMIALGLLITYFNKKYLFLTWFIIMCLLGIAGMYDFYMWEYEYGHNLNPKAAIKFLDEFGEPLAYQPPLIGTKIILNFVATSLPMAGAYFLFGGMLSSLLAFLVAKKQ